MITLSVMQLFRIISLICLGFFTVTLIKWLVDSEVKAPFVIATLWALIPFIYIIVRD